MRTLVVDDFATIRKVIRNQLVSIGHADILDAGDGVEAIKVLQENAIDFIITDWNMPNASGLDLLKFVRTHDKFAHIPVLMVTAEANKEQIMLAAKAGVDGYIVKPFSADLIREKINKILARRNGVH
jgi:two-component system chemotaxis response regulator CheY